MMSRKFGWIYACLEYVVFAAVFFALFALRNDYNLEDGIIFWKYAYYKIKGRVFLPLLEYTMLAGHPLWVDIHIAFYKLCTKFVPSISVKDACNIVGSLVGALSAFFCCKTVRLMKEEFKDALLCIAFFVCSYSFVIFGTTVNTGIFAIFAVNFFLYYYLSYAQKGFPLYSAVFLGVIFTVACVFYVSPSLTVPGVVAGFMLYARRAGWRTYWIFCLALFALTSYLSAYVLYNAIYKYVGNSDITLFDCIGMMILYSGINVHFTFTQRISQIFSNMGGQFFGGGYIAFYMGAAIYILFYLLFMRILVCKLYRQKELLIMLLLVLTGIGMNCFSSVVQYPKAILGLLMPMSYVLYKSISMAERPAILKKHKNSVVAIFLLLMVGANIYIMKNPHCAHLYRPQAPNDVATMGFYRYVHDHVPKDAVVLYDASYVGRNFGNFLLFFSERESITDTDDGILFLGGRNAFGEFYKHAGSTYGSIYLVATRGAFQNILVPSDARFSSYAVFCKMGQYGGVALYKYSGMHPSRDFVGRYFQDGDIESNKAHLRVMNKSFTHKFEWLPIRWNGQKSLIMIPIIDKKNSEVKDKVLFYW
jgi:hypothetical protein